MRRGSDIAHEALSSEGEIMTPAGFKETLVTMAPLLEGQTRRTNPDPSVERDFMAVMLSMRRRGIELRSLDLDQRTQNIVDAYWRKIGN